MRWLDRLRTARSAAASQLPPIRAAGMGLEVANLRRTVEALNASGVTYFAIPTDQRTPARLGMPAAGLQDAIEGLRRSGSGLSLSVGRGDQVFPLGAMSADGLSPGDVLFVHAHPGSSDPLRLSLEARPCVLEPWYLDPDDGLHHAVLTNAYAVSVDLRVAGWGEIQLRGQGPFPTLLDFTVRDISEPTFPIDAVMLWVDGADPAWQERRDAAAGVSTNIHDAGTHASRFREHGELRFALRSLEMFAPWINRVHLVTDRQRPAWLAEDSDKVVVVDHTEIFGSFGRLPSFNSHAISARIHHVPNLSEHFVYLNDDVFFGRPVKPEQWFESTGMPTFHPTSTRLPGASVAVTNLPVRARRRVADLVERDFGVRPHRIIQHGPHPMRRSTLLSLEQRYAEEFHQTWGNQFRGPDDIEIVWLHNYVGYLTGRARPAGGVNYAYLGLSLDATAAEMQVLVQRRHKDVFCINDDDATDVAGVATAALPGFLETMFPERGSFERAVEPAQSFS